MPERLKKFKIALFAIIVLFPIVAFAQTSGLKDAFPMVNKVSQTTILPYRNDVPLATMIGNIAQLIISVLGVIFVIFIVYAGGLWVNAAGNESKIDKAKDILKQSIIGLIITIGAYAISYFIINAFSAQVKL